MIKITDRDPGCQCKEYYIHEDGSSYVSFTDHQGSLWDQEYQDPAETTRLLLYLKERMKKNIEKMKNEIEKINQLYKIVD